MIRLQDYGYTGLPAGQAMPEGVMPARVTGVHRALYQVVCAQGEKAAVLKGAYLHRAGQRADFPAVGDFVLIKANESGPAQITRLLTRKSKFSRTDFSGHAAGYVKTVLEQVVAANFDYVFILCSLNHDFKVSRIIRYLAQARQSGGEPVVLLTKADLCEEYAAQVQAARQIAGGAVVLPISSHTGLGLDALSGYLQPGKTIVFLGSSGVGKSSLLNALAGQGLMAVQSIREEDSRGRHTTTHRQLFRLPCGALVIDTPGMRELGLWQAGEGIGVVFAEMEALAARCRFSDCSHTREPGCAVRAAMEDGTLDPKQWQAYCAHRREAAFVARKAKHTKTKK